MRAGRLTPPRPWAALSDPEWAALSPHLDEPQGGRRVAEPRARLDAIFWASCRFAAWHTLPEAFGRPQTVARHFRRLTDRGLWQRLLHALAAAPEGHPLRAIEPFIVRACRRAARRLGIEFLRLIRALGLRSALPGPPWLLPDPDFARRLARFPAEGAEEHRLLARLLRTLQGRARIPRALRLAWP
jgi:transposase